MALQLGGGMLLLSTLPCRDGLPCTLGMVPKMYREMLVRF